MSQKSVLIVDDEPGILDTLAGALSDEGLLTIQASSAEQALNILENRAAPDLAFLDIWLPGMDGIELLKLVRQRFPETKIVMMSGHATIATAIKATQLGAADFIEKPLDLHTLLAIVQRLLDPAQEQDVEELEINRSAQKLNQSLFKHITLDRARLSGRKFPQRTLKTSAVLYGQGLHSGKKSGLIFEPLPANTGIHFTGIAELAPVPAQLDYVESTGFATTIRLGNTQAGTIEHLMSALHAYGISNLLIKCNGEVPVMDGSSLAFCDLFEDTGIVDQAADWAEFVIDKLYKVGDDKEYIMVEPADQFSVEYTLDYPQPLGRQVFHYTLSDVESYKSEIAPARTFGFVKDIGMLQKQGLALGGRFDNFVLFGEEGAINTKLRFDNEPVRHKILDAIGDLFLLGCKLRGKVSACMTGHSDNVELLKRLCA